MDIIGHIADIDNMSQEKLNEYDDWLEYLYTK